MSLRVRKYQKKIMIQDDLHKFQNLSVFEMILKTLPLPAAWCACEDSWLLRELDFGVSDSEF